MVNSKANLNAEDGEHGGIADEPVTLAVEPVKTVEFDGQPRCEFCKAGVFSKDLETGGCRLNPPVHQQFVIPAVQMRPNQPAFDIQGYAQYPYVKRDWFCIRGFQLREDVKQ